jgi:hypothetical protein
LRHCSGCKHESGAEFKAYTERLRPLVEPYSVLFGDTEPLGALGYELPGRPERASAA